MRSSGSAGRTATAYDLVAATYAAALPDDGFEAPLDRAMIADFAGRVARTTGCRVIDAGSGAGRMAPVLVRHGLQYTGVDLSQGMVDTARVDHPDQDFLQGSVTALPAPDGSADGVLSWYSVIHTDPDELPVVLAEFARVLRPDGLLLLGFQAGRGRREIHRAYGHDVALTAFLHEPGAVQRQLADAGFTTEATLVRRPRTSEKDDQAIILATLPAEGSGRR